MAQMTLSLANICQARESSQDPRQFLTAFLRQDAESIFGRPDIPDEEIWHFLYKVASTSDLRSPSPERLPVTDIQTVIDLIDRAERIVVLLGAGGSVGPDFRSSGGLYDQISQTKLLDDPCDVFDSRVYHEDPSYFWQFAHNIFPPENPTYSSAHYFLEKLQKRHKLHRIYTQNVDTLERGIPEEKLRCVHGSWRNCHCGGCGRKFSLDFLRPYVEAREVPRCPDCNSIIEPGIVFFGEQIQFDELEAYNDSQVADLLLVIGTSLKVAPISGLPSMMPNIPAILINRAPVDVDFNAELLGECDDIFSMIEYELGWSSEGKTETDVIQFRSSSYVIPSLNPEGTHIEETPKTDFLVSPCPFDAKDLD